MDLNDILPNKGAREATHSALYTAKPLIKKYLDVLRTRSYLYNFLRFKATIVAARLGYGYHGAAQAATYLRGKPFERLQRNHLLQHWQFADSIADNPFWLFKSSKDPTSVSWRAWLTFAALGIIWGVPYFFIKLAVEELSPFVVAWGRIVLAVAILLPIAWRRGALRSLGPHKAAICTFAFVEFVIPFSAISIGERWIPSSITGILIASVPLTIVLLSRFFGVHERLGFRRLLGLTLGLVGVVALLEFDTISGPYGWAGVGCMLLATSGYAIGGLIIQRHLGGIDSIGPIAVSLLIAGVVLLIPAAMTAPAHLPSATALWSIAVLGVACTAVAMLLMFYLISHAGASRASVITYINPAVATLLGVVLLHEHLGVGGITAFALILLGSFLATRGVVGEPRDAASQPG